MAEKARAESKKLFKIIIPIDRLKKFRRYSTSGAGGSGSRSDYSSHSRGSFD
jgi:hypothetical protein